MDTKITATATVLTYNSARTLADCLAPLAAFDEILVLDGGSSDETLAIARRFGARIEPQAERPGPVADFTAVRERSFKLASHDWIFVVDSDETADSELISAIRSAVSGDDRTRAYRVERVPVVNGKTIRYAYFSPDRIIRLVNRGTARWEPGKRVHEHLALAPGTLISDLAGMLKTVWPSLVECRRKDRRYLALAMSKPLARRPPFAAAVRAIFKNAARSVGILFCAFYLTGRYGRTGAVLPFAYHLRFVRYHAAVVRERFRQLVYGQRYTPPAA
ncbi:glycosyltransferase family 2 protein [Patescibacteria group bacterium]|nr:MAG: glycosyltransferase family 2 protein [Patescibacteria group bacterium]